MKIDFWFDPACPFCWVTSRWIEDIKDRRDLDINWRAISLFFKNDLASQPDSPFYDVTKKTLGMLRVAMAVKAAGHADQVGPLYTELGRRIHNRHETDFDLAPILASLELDPGLAEAAVDDSWDAAVRADMADFVALVGEDVGTPAIALDGTAGRVTPSTSARGPSTRCSSPNCRRLIRERRFGTASLPWQTLRGSSNSSAPEPSTPTSPTSRSCPQFQVKPDALLGEGRGKPC
jgi:protein-disulfide isomerase-like protein with CxxC motif